MALKQTKRLKPHTVPLIMVGFAILAGFTIFTIGDKKAQQASSASGLQSRSNLILNEEIELGEMASFQLSQE